MFPTQTCGVFGNCLTNSELLKEDCVPSSAKACVASYMPCFVHHLLLSKNNKHSWSSFSLKLSGEVDLPWIVSLEELSEGLYFERLYFASNQTLWQSRHLPLVWTEEWMRGAAFPWSNKTSWIQFVTIEIYPPLFCLKVQEVYSSLPKRNSPSGN